MPMMHVVEKVVAFFMLRIEDHISFPAGIRRPDLASGRMADAKPTCRY
jgi:hypothetical protein